MRAIPTFAHWRFESRQVDLIAEGYDAAIGGGIELAPGLVTRTLAPLHIIAVASPAYMKAASSPLTPRGLVVFDGIVMRSTRMARIRERIMRDAAGAEVAATLKETIVLDDPKAMCRAALLGLGVTLIAVPHALPHLEKRALVRLVPQWYGWYRSGTPMPGRSQSITPLEHCSEPRPAFLSPLSSRVFAVIAWHSASREALARLERIPAI